MGMGCVRALSLGLAVSLAGCQPSAPPTRQAVTELISPATPSPSPQQERNGWRKPRYISVDEAVARLQPHVDFPVALPDMKLAYLPPVGRWMADPKYLDWSKEQGVRNGTLKLFHKDKLIILDFGLVSFDGCGGTDFAVPTEVGDVPAMLFVARDGPWSRIVWPMRPLDTTGTYGLAGTLEAWQAHRLAESLEIAISAASDDDQGC